MKTMHHLLALSAIALAASVGAQAQTASGEMSGSQKAEQGATKPAKPGPSATTRAEQRKEAIAARKAGQVTEGECAPDQKADAGACKKPAAAKSGTTRAEVKKEAVEARKAGATTSGEMSEPQKKDSGAKK